MRLQSPSNPQGYRALSADPGHQRLATLPFQHLHILIPRTRYLPHRNRKVPVPRDPKTIGGYLRKRRLELGLLQSEVARKLGVSMVTLSRWEGDKVYPTWEFQLRIAEYLGHDPFLDPERGRPHNTTNKKALPI